MDSSGAFEADADIEQRLETSPGQSRHQAQNAIDVAAGGLDPEAAQRDETSPLLGRQESQLSDTSKNPQGDGQVPQWSGEHDFDGLPWYKTPSVYWLLPPFLLFALAFGGVIVPKTNLAKSLICRDYFTKRILVDPNNPYAPPIYDIDDPQCKIPEVNARAAAFMLGNTVIGGLLTALVSPYLGSLSDRYGRKKFIALTAAGGLINELFAIAAAKYPATFPVGLLYLGFVADGICGSFIAGMAICHAYATDCTHPSKRGVAFGLFHGCLFIGIALGPIIGGLIIKKTGTLETMFWLAFGCHLVFIVFLGFVIPESLTQKRQIVAREKYSEELAQKSEEDRQWYSNLRPSRIFRPLNVLRPTGPGSSPALRRNIGLMCAIDTIMFGVVMGAVSVMVYYMDVQFKWGNYQETVYMSTVNSCRVAVLFIILPIITRIFRGPASARYSRIQKGADNFDLGSIRVAVFFDTLGFLGYTLARTGELFILSGCVASLGGIGSPTLQSTLTRHLPPDRMGQLLGATAMLHSIARLVSPLIFNALFAATVGKYNQAVYLCLTVAFGVAFTLTWLLKPGVYFDETKKDSSIRHDEDNQEEHVSR